MKKIFLLLTVMSMGWMAKAQVPVFSPATFTAEDSVTVTIDVTGTPMAGQTEAYIWIFSNAGDGLTTNTSWSNSPDAAKMKNIGTNKWQFGFIGTTLFGKTPAELKSFGFLLKAKDGSKQTPDYKTFNFDPLVFTPTMLRVFPARADRDDAVTVNFDRSLGASVNEQRMAPATATITMFDDAGTQVGTPLNIMLKKTTDNVWSAVFIPSASFTATGTRKLAKFNYKFNGTVLDASGAATTVSSSETEFQFTTLK